MSNPLEPRAELMEQVGSSAAPGAAPGAASDAPSEPAELDEWLNPIP